MLKKRIIACILVKNGLAVQSIGFEKYLPIGSPIIVAEYLNKWGVDEIVYLDIDATINGREPNYRQVESVAKACFVPLSVGGGIKSINHMRDLTRCGADKIIVNSSLFEQKNLLMDAASAFGSQCIVAAVDVIKSDNSYLIKSNSGTIDREESLINWVLNLEKLGAGEIFVNCIHKDGKKTGFDIEILKEISDLVNVPVIGCGGMGSPQHVVDVFSGTDISGAAIGNYFNFIEHAPVILKSYLKTNNIDTRIDTEYDYNDHPRNMDGAIVKKDASALYELTFTYHEPEII